MVRLHFVAPLVSKGGFTMIGKMLPAWLESGSFQFVSFRVLSCADLSFNSFFNYTAVVVASSFGGLLSRAELEMLIARKRELEAYIKNGGMLFVCQGILYYDLKTPMI